MKKVVCIDTGLFSNFSDEQSPVRLKKLWSMIENESIQPDVLQPTISEAIYHLCKIKGKEYALMKIKTLIDQFHFNIIPLDENILFQAGLLKCQNRKKLSYNDCFSIAHCLKCRIPFYTTEKGLKKIPHPVLAKLIVVSFRWD